MKKKTLLKTDKNFTYDETRIIYGIPVEIYNNDYGQCLVYAFKNPKGEINYSSCGTWNTDVDEIIEDAVKESWYQPSKELNKLWKAAEKYAESFSTKNKREAIYRQIRPALFMIRDMINRMWEEDKNSKEDYKFKNEVDKILFENWGGKLFEKPKDKKKKKKSK